MKPESKYFQKIAGCLEEIFTMGLAPEEAIDIILIIRDKREPLIGTEATNEAGVLMVSTGDDVSTVEMLRHCLDKHGKVS